FTFEERYRRKDGSLVWVQNNISLTRDSQNRPLHLIAITHDITARKKVEEELLLVSRVPGENPHPVLRLSPDGKVLYSNDAAAPMLESWKQASQQIPDDLMKQVRSAFNDGAKKEIEIEYRDRTVSCTIAPIIEAGYVNIYGTDITSRKMTVEALRESEQRFSRFMQQLPGLAWIKDVDGRYVYANDAAERSFGTTKAELYGKVDEEVFPLEFAKQFREHDRIAVESGSGIQVLESLVEDDGIRHYSIVSKFPISGSDGKPALIGGMAIDVTEQKQAEEELRRRMEFDEAVMTNMGEGLYTVDSKGLVTSMNPAAEKLFGWTFEELGGRKMHDVTHYKHRDGSPFPADKCAGLQVLKEGKTLVNREDVFIRKDGTFFDVLFSSSPLRESGETTGLVVVFQDISERKRADETLARYRHLSEYANDVIWMVNADGQIVEVNQAAVELYGYDREELLGMNVRQLRDPSTFSTLDNDLQAANAGNIHFETLHVKKDGTSFPVEVNASSAEFGGERLIMSILRDITDRKRQERNHEFLFRLSDLIRTESDPNEIVNTTMQLLGKYLEIDRCFIESIDLERKTSTVINEYFAGEFEPLVPTVKFSEYSQANLKAAQAGKTIVVMDTARDRRTVDKHAAGYSRDRIGSYIAVPLIREGQWAATLFASHEDPYEWSEWEVSLVQTVAERVWLAVEKLRSEAALLESERRAIEQYQSLLERIVPLAETLGGARDLTGIYRALHEFICASMRCSGFFVSFYDAAAHRRLPAYVWGEGEEIDVASLPPMPITPGGGPNSQAIFSKQTVITTAYWDQQKNRPHLVLKENGIDPMSSIVVPMVVQDRVIGTLEVQAHENEAFNREHAVALEMAANLAAVAIENVRLIEIEARARADAESANRMKDEFLSVLSHELRTPLNAMLGWVRILRSGNVDQDRLEKALEIIERNTRQQSSLIEDLLDVSRIISGKMRIESELIDLVQSLGQAAENVRPLAVAKGVEFEVQVASEPLYLKGDIVRLQQVFTNLLQNAIKFTPGGGSVALKFATEDSNAVITVRDTGVGIESEFLPHIFDRFSQADASTRRTNSGLGLGLTIVRTIVEMHGGVITAESEGPNKGASFRVRLPLAEEFYKSDASPVVVVNGSSESLSGVRIIVVDDDVDGLAPLRILLEREKASVATATSATEALERLKLNDFDILISDIGMPSMDGFELISRLRQNKEQRNHGIKAIAYTAYASEEDRNRVLSAGYHVHLAKPLDFDELLTIVKNFGNSVRSDSQQN
ncbi:MAG TPA: PAS domain S-box protein, partial [Pyrinomonadaceae bacterium]|nr:PAS domain S-box protein [Pyrinomonadaceae bacterium]